ncbi:MAG: zinc-dependent peptidase [Tatlockia sp.]|nr:zinc-dependent peptidase [Tatlockia sp.]
MFRRLKEKWNERLIKRSDISNMQWQNGFQILPLLKRLNEDERARLKNLAILFLHYKSLEAVDLELTTEMKLIIALQACLPILNLGLNWFKGWRSVIIYPGSFAREDIEIDECGVVHQSRVYLSGESWQQGVIVLSWNDALPKSENDGYNVVIHEFAHKLDMLNGSANGLPPLHSDMLVQHWAEVFNKAYADFERRLQDIPINPYAQTSPAEFFAVFSEYFFEKPEIIAEIYPDVYQLLVKFYRQNPLIMAQKHGPNPYII